MCWDRKKSCSWIVLKCIRLSGLSTYKYTLRLAQYILCMLPGWEQGPEGRRSRGWWDLQEKKRKRKEERETEKGIIWINDRMGERVAHTWVWIDPTAGDSPKSWYKPRPVWLLKVWSISPNAVSCIFIQNESAHVSDAGTEVQSSPTPSLPWPRPHSPRGNLWPRDTSATLPGALTVWDAHLCALVYATQISWRTLLVPLSRWENRDPENWDCLFSILN